MDNFTAQIRRAFNDAINATQELSWLREQNESPKVALDGVLDVVIELSPSLIQILVMIWMKAFDEMGQLYFLDLIFLGFKLSTFDSKRLLQLYQDHI